MAERGGEEPLGGGLFARKLPADCALVEHEDAVAHAEQLGQFAGDEDDRLALRR